ncbi:MAG: type II secretion system protein GspG [Ponticaulis sp.]|nr:type II secretion system protein GspG [Ponticaulis sp.]|tara:strand:- start:7221 stop:7700 length:480 start_codon:yes stop_codon:yes gene_type:complete
MKALVTALKKRLTERQTGEDGFSLTEIMVAVFIMGLLATVVVVNVLPMRDRAMQQKVVDDVQKLEGALYDYSLAMRTFPSQSQGLSALIEAPSGVNNADNYPEGGFLLRNQLPKDPWGNEYEYRNPGEHGRIDVFSYGADGRPGGEGLDADIGNWAEEE